jgi:hypothetical protein
LVLSSIIPQPALDKYKFKFQFWARDVTIIRNMTTTKWMNVACIIDSNTAAMTDLSDREVPRELVLGDLIACRCQICGRDRSGLEDGRGDPVPPSIS